MSDGFTTNGLGAQMNRPAGQFINATDKAQWTAEQWDAYYRANGKNPVVTIGMGEVVAKLRAEKAALVTYAHMKLDSGDYHGAADACMDLREIDAKLSVLNA